MERVWLFLFRVASRCFPAAFRERFGSDMTEAFRLGMAHRSRFSGRQLYAIRMIVGQALAGLGERRGEARVAGTERHGQGGWWMDGWWKDVRFAFRALLRRPGYALVASVTIALGVGANTAIFSLIHGVLLAPLDYRDPDGLVMVGESTNSPPRLSTISAPESYALEELSAVGEVVAVRNDRMTLTGVGPPEMLSGARVTRGLLSVFGERPALGRDLRPEEGRNPEAHRVVVVSHGFWTERLGEDPEAVGRTVVLDGDAYAVVGVAPEGWAYPSSAEFWAPGGTLEGDCWWGCNLFRAVARLAPGATVDQLASEAAVLSERLAADHPDTQTNRSFRVHTLQEYQVGEVRQGLWILLGAVAVVLLIACANVANLMLVRGQTRRREMAVRTALGASRARRIREVLAESLVLAMMGAALGVGLAVGVLEALPVLAAGAIPRLDRVALDGPVLLFTAGLTLAAALAFGVVPALRTAGSGGLAGTARSGRGASPGVRERRARSLLLSAEVALSLVLLVGAGLLLRSFASLARLDPGYTTERVVRFDLSLPESVYDEADEVWTFVRDLEERLRAVPGVREVAAGMGTPLTRYQVGAGVTVLDRPEPEPGEGAGAAMRAVTPSYFDLQDIRILRGRGFDGTERNGDPSVYLVNETFVRRYLQDREDPLGTPIEMGVSFGFGRRPGAVIGVVEDVRTQDLWSEPEPEIYVAFSQYLPTFFSVSVQVEPGARVVESLRETLLQADPNLPLFGLDTIEEAVGEELAPTRFYLALLGGFALLAVVLAAVGLYGVVSYAVAGRTGEIGVRVALGADRDGIVRMVFRDGLRPTALGLVVGLAVAAGSVPVLRSLLFGVQPLDPLTFVAVPVLVVGVAVAAILVPARRAARVDPVQAFRAE